MAKQIVTDYRTSPEAAAELGRLGYEVVFTKPLPELYREIQGHADIQLHIFNGKAFCAPQTYSHYREALRGTEVICGASELSAQYPYDIAYNTCEIGGYAVCSRKFTDAAIISEYEAAGRKILNTRQGYAKCSICVVNHESAITADEGIYKLLKENGINVLNIRQGYIRLYDMGGFIGGASGLLEENVLAFNGDIRTHPDCDSILDFCRSCGVEVVSLAKGELQDVGSIMRTDI
ncbi:MAG: DUF6873 family GME fold protein [Candidatus Ornithomonoglobus sp.]